MFVSINRLRVPAEYSERLEEGFTRSSGMDGVAGFRSFELLRSQEGGEYLVVTRWDDRPSFEAWREGDAFQRAHTGTNPQSPVKSELGVYDVVLHRP